jgi:hypothetical protein
LEFDAITKEPSWAGLSSSSRTKPSCR